MFRWMWGISLVLAAAACGEKEAPVPDQPPAAAPATPPSAAQPAVPDSMMARDTARIP